MQRAQRLSGTLPSSALRHVGSALASWLLGFALVAYLMLETGGFDPIVRGEVGIAVWWIFLVGIATGFLHPPLRSRAALALAALLVLYLAWTALALSWTVSEERTVTEIARVATYLGFLALALCAAAQRRARHLLGGASAAIGLVVTLAVLSRLQPQLFPDNVIGAFLPGIEIERRLAYPLGYSSAVGVLAGMAIPLLAGAAHWARSLPAQALAAAALPLAGFTWVLAHSGVGTATVAVGLIAYLLLSPDRLPRIATLLLGAAGTAILAAGLAERPALDRGLPTPAALAEGDGLLLTAVLVCLGVALLHTALALAARFARRPHVLQPSRRTAAIATVATVLVAIPLALAAGAPDWVSDNWENFRGGDAVQDQTNRGQVLFDTSSSGRYQFWESAVRAGNEKPLRGLGPGTFEFHWAQDPEGYAFVRDAHSLYVENYAELGLIGLGLTLGLVLLTLAIGLVRGMRAGPAARGRIAAASAAAAAFGAGAALDWIWEIAALPALFLLLVAVIAVDEEGDEIHEITAHRVRHSRSGQSRFARLAPRIAAGLLALACLYAIWSPYQADVRIRESQIAVAEGQLAQALGAANDAVAARPGSSAALLQEAIVLELQQRVPAALTSARRATRAEPENWRTWATLSRLEAKAGNAQAAVRALRRAQQVNPGLAGQ